MDAKIDEDGWQGFLELCVKAKNPEALEQLFHLFFTMEEKESFSARYLIIKALVKEHMTQRKISEEYKVSIAQITRGSNALKIIDAKLKQFLKTNLK